MEPLDTDLDYAARSSHELDPRKRFNWLYILPVLGLLWLVFLATAALFQIPITSVVDPIMGLMIVVFFVMVALLFWALAPKANR
jgi:hypothetical protein